MFFGFKMKRLITEYDLDSCDGVYYGYIENYLTSISYHDRGYEMFIEIPVYSFSRDLYDTIKDFILEHSDENGITAYNIASSGISLFFNALSFNKMKSFIDRFLSVLGPSPESIKNICGNCGLQLSGNDCYIRIGYHVHHVDNECSEDLKNSPAEQILASAKGHPVSGMIGALLFSLLAVSGYLFAAYRGFLCSWILFFVPVLLIFGYMLFGGKPSGFMAVLVIVLPVILFIISLTGLLSAEIGLNWFSEGYTFTVGELLDHAAAYYRKEIINGNSFISGQLFSGGLFLILGIVFSLTFSIRAKHISNVHVIEEKAA